MMSNRTSYLSPISILSCYHLNDFDVRESLDLGPLIILCVCVCRGY